MTPIPDDELRRLANLNRQVSPRISTHFTNCFMVHPLCAQEQIMVLAAELLACREALRNLITQAQEWCEAVEQDTSWDGWDHHYKGVSANLPFYRALLPERQKP